MPKLADPQTPAAARTRGALIAAALHLFGEKGFDAASTREIAARAGANIAAIAYHFGSKEGLRLACVDAISDQLDEILPRTGLPRPAGAAEARAMLERILRAVLAFMIAPGPSQEIAAFLLREIATGGPMVDPIHDRIVGPRHRAVCALWGAATGRDPESESVRLAVFAMMGQVIYFRIGQPMILRRLDWDEVGPARAERIATLLVGNLHAALSASERSTP